MDHHVVFNFNSVKSYVEKSDRVLSRNNIFLDNVVGNHVLNCIHSEHLYTINCNRLLDVYTVNKENLLVNIRVDNSNGLY